MSEISDRVRGQLDNQEYRHAYAQEFLDMTLARQIRALRKDRNWSQAQLAEILGTHQSRISEIESEEYGALSIATLKALAEAFDVYLNVRFSSFAEMLDQVDRTAMGDLVVPSYPDDTAVKVIEEKIHFSMPGVRPMLPDTRWPISGAEQKEAMILKAGNRESCTSHPKLAA